MNGSFRSRLRRLEHLAAARALQHKNVEFDEMDETLAVCEATGDPRTTQQRVFALLRAWTLEDMRDDGDQDEEVLLQLEGYQAETWNSTLNRVFAEQFLLDRELVDFAEMAGLEEWRESYGPAVQPLRNRDREWLQSVFRQSAEIDMFVNHAWRPGRVTINLDGELIGEGRTYQDAYTAAVGSAAWQRRIKARHLNAD